MHSTVYVCERWMSEWEKRGRRECVRDREKEILKRMYYNYIVVCLVLLYMSLVWKLMSLFSYKTVVNIIQLYKKGMTTKNLIII